MSKGKIVLLVVYVILIGLVLLQGDTTAGIWSLRVLGLFAVAHAIEAAIFFKVCKAAGGSLAGHLLSVFLFGVIHVGEIKAAQAID